MKNCLTSKIELLSPAGGMDSLKAAVNNGCDAVYLGGKAYSARGAAENFDINGLEAAIDYAHVRGVRVYITVNTLYTDGELNALIEFCANAYSLGADAFIVQDIGAARLLRDTFDIPLHASTQLNATTLADAEFLKTFGFSRVVLGRETPLNEIKRITRAVDSEVFIHGALCYSHSGQCLLSSFMGGRSGNRGNCAQPCRLNYTLMRGTVDTVITGSLLSPKDMMTLALLPKILDAGVTSLKIEGRMKNPQYVALATAAYRQCLDALTADTDMQNRAEQSDAANGTITVQRASSASGLGLPESCGSPEYALAQVFSRGGSFCEGYLRTHSSPGMMSESVRSSGSPVGEVINYIPRMGKCVIAVSGELVGGDGIVIGDTGAYYNSAVPAVPGDRITVDISGNISAGDSVYKSYDKRLDRALKKMAGAEERKLTLRARVRAVAGERLTLTLSHGDITLAEHGGVVEPALQQPLTRERLLKQLAKTGGTPFSLALDACDIGDSVYIDIKALNALRRSALERMTHRIRSAYKREPVQIRPVLSAAVRAEQADSRLTVLATTEEQARAAIACDPYRLYIECTSGNLELLRTLRREGVKVFAALPSSPWPEADMLCETLADVDGYLVRTYGQLHRLRDTCKELALDYSFNVTNTHAFAVLAEQATSVCLSPEPWAEPIADARAEAIAYGRIALMTTNLCPVGLYVCKKNSGRYCGARGDWQAYSLIDRKGESLPILRDCEACTARVLSRPIRRSVGGAGYARLEFTTETSAECERIITEASKK